MPVPAEYERASAHFYAFLVDARDFADLCSTHVAFTMTEGVFRVFRRRISISEAIEFANLLPIGLRALFVTDWDIGEPRLLFGDRVSMTAEVRSVRPEHNFAPDDAITCVARALRRWVDADAFDEFLALLPKGATEFWSTEGPSRPL